MSRQPFSHSQSNAFTLIELLVVISIIALLIGILMPALSASRKSAQNVQCLTKLRQIGVATYAYTNDNKGCMPYAHSPELPTNISWPAVARLSGPDSVYGSYMNLNTSWNGPFMCPTYQNDGILPKAQVSGSSDLKVSYTYNSSLGHNGYTGSVIAEIMRIDQVKTPSLNAYIVDGIYRNSTKVQYAVHYSHIGVSDVQPMNRHPSDSNNLLYIDGHAKSMPGDDLIANRAIVWNIVR